MSDSVTAGDQRHLFGQGRVMAKDSSGSGSNWYRGTPSDNTGGDATVYSRVMYEGTVTATDMDRATDVREKGRQGIFGTSDAYAGSYSRVTSESIGRDLNPLGRGDGNAYVAGALNMGRISPALPKSRALPGTGNSVNNGCQSGCGLSGIERQGVSLESESGIGPPGLIIGREVDNCSELDHKMGWLWGCNCLKCPIYQKPTWTPFFGGRCVCRQPSQGTALLIWILSNMWTWSIEWFLSGLPSTGGHYHGPGRKDCQDLDLPSGRCAGHPDCRDFSDFTRPRPIDFCYACVGANNEDLCAKAGKECLKRVAMAICDAIASAAGVKVNCSEIVDNLDLNWDEILKDIGQKILDEIIKLIWDKIIDHLIRLFPWLRAVLLGLDIYNAIQNYRELKARLRCCQKELEYCYDNVYFSSCFTEDGAVASWAEVCPPPRAGAVTSSAGDAVASSGVTW